MSLFVREIIKDSCICSKSFHRLSRREKKSARYPRYYKGTVSPAASAEICYPSFGPTKGEKIKTYHRLKQFDSDDWGLQREIHKPEIACQCGLIDNWNGGKGSYPFGEKSKENLLECGQRISERLEEKGFEIDESLMLASLRENREAGMADYDNLKKSVEAASG